ncbi:DUF4232 domain-containing protein [Streptomyces sp. NPDC096132]|uniref:DUF4232 domain-containing protein n=1 Tax=Streptomyces sp. NPDC096132 TaxID=3366075 RepID=UPI0038059C7B
MRRPMISAVAVLLLVGTAGCSSDPDSPSSASSSPGAGYIPRSGSDSAASGTADDGGAQTGGSSGDGGHEGSGGTSGDSGDGASPSAGVLYGADSLPSAAADHCRTTNLRAVARGTGQGRASVVITNKGDGSCTVRGFPSLLFVGEAGRVELPVDWAGSVADAAKFTLEPGASASAALTFTSLDECDAITGLDIVPPGESRPLTPAFTASGGKKEAVRICDTGVRLKAFAPSG